MCGVGRAAVRGSLNGVQRHHCKSATQRRDGAPFDPFTHAKTRLSSQQCVAKGSGQRSPGALLDRAQMCVLAYDHSSTLSRGPAQHDSTALSSSVTILNHSTKLYRHDARLCLSKNAVAGLCCFLWAVFCRPPLLVRAQHYTSATHMCTRGPAGVAAACMVRSRI